MAGEIDRNQIDSEGRGRSTNKGDVPDPLLRRYYLDARGGPGLGFYTDARIKTATFRDLGARLVTPRSDPNAIRDMAAVAQHRGWTVVVVHGEADFRREAWLTASALGLEVRGYQPTPVPDNVLQEVFTLAQLAPSNCNAGTTPLSCTASRSVSHCSIVDCRRSWASSRFTLISRERSIASTPCHAIPATTERIRIETSTSTRVKPVARERLRATMARQ